MVLNLYSLSISSNDDYNVFKTKNYEIVFTKDYINEAKYIKSNLDALLKYDQKSFGYKLDQPLKIVLISDNIQLPNAFSTQIPFNQTVLYNGGDSMNDYFTTSSWVDTLLTHELIHNYQMNAKKSKISKTLHKYLGNNYMPVFAILPFFTIPNMMLPTAIVEGNAVLNESLHNNGGRLYNGELRALKNSLILANKITPNSLLNNSLEFPYLTQKYIVGGYYMSYLAQRFGLDKVNSFFYAHSIHSINPLLLNTTYLEHFGITFTQSVYDFIHYTKQTNQNFHKLLSANVLAKSKSRIEFSNIYDNKIYFITTNLVDSKKLNIFDITNKTLSSSQTDLANGKIFKINNKLYSRSYQFISSTLYKAGLCDDKLHILKDTQGKYIQDISNNNQAYIDIKKSFVETSLFIDGKFYDTISSSAKFDNNQNIYYFKQHNQLRSLIKNKKTIFSFDGYYSKLVDIIDDKIYFIANTKYGSSLYCYNNGSLFRLSVADNIIDAKIISSQKAIVQTVDENGYSVSKLELQPTHISYIPYMPIPLTKEKFLFNKKSYNNQTLQTKKYNELKNLEFSMLYPTYSTTSDGTTQYTLDAVFLDPLMFNMLDIFRYKIDTQTYTGLSYTNERYIPFDFTIYKNDDSIYYANQRDTAGSVDIYGPLLHKGRDQIDIKLKQYFDEDNKDKNPVILWLNHIYNKKFLLAENSAFLSNTQIFAKEDREDDICGLKFDLTKQLYQNIYLEAGLKYISSNTKVLQDQRGIELSPDIIDIQKDMTNLYYESSDYDIYVKDVTKTTLKLSKTFYYSKYYPVFPVSLRKETLFVQYNHFDFTTEDKYKVDESIVGVKFDTLFFHTMPIPLVLKYIHNDSVINSDQIKFSIGMQF